jgi:hypothetical protein
MLRKTGSRFLLLAIACAFGAARAIATFTQATAGAGLAVSPPAKPPEAIDPLVSLNYAVCATDLDRDGWTDLLLSPVQGRLLVYRNNRDGTFREEGIQRGFGNAVDIGGIAAGDLSNNGRTDVILVPRSGPRYFLYVNDGDGYFSERAVERGVDLTVTGETHKGQSIGLVDYDRDGFLDIHVTEWGVSGASDTTRYAVLLRNRGREAPGHFVNATASSGLRQPHFGSSSRGFSSAWADFDDDGYPDLALISDFRTSQLWWSNGNGTFTEGSAAAGVGKEQAGMGVAVGDFNRDGRLDYFVSTFDFVGAAYASANKLYLNQGDRKFQEVADTWGVTDSSWGWGAVFIDPNNDGWLDLLVTNGYPYVAPPNQPNPPRNVIVDATTDRTRFFLNNGWKMTESGQLWGVTDTGEGYGVTVLDYDNDGDEDILIGNRAGQVILYRNDAPRASSRWLRLRFTGTVSNRDGYGALVRVTVGGVTQTAVYAPTNAYIGQREPVLHFGLGSAAVVDSVVIQWPNGAVQKLTAVTSNQVLSVVEPEVTTNQPPTLTPGLVGGTFTKDSNVVLRTSATGRPAPVFTWKKDGVALRGATGPELHLTRIHPSDSGWYSVVATNVAGQVESAAVWIDVTADMTRQSVARWWNEALLDGIRRDTPNPPVHARNLYHLSAALWDAFWAYETGGWSTAAPMFHRENPPLPAAEAARVAAQREAMSHAAQRIILARFAKSPGASSTQEGARWLMKSLGYDPANTSTAGDSPAAVGNRIGQAILDTTRLDGANDANGYADATGYVSVNEPLVVGYPGTSMTDPNRWQPLSLAFSVTQNGIVLPSGLQRFVGVNARLTEPFALAKPTRDTIALDPGPPPRLGGDGSARLVEEVVDVISRSSMLDPADGVEIDISPGASGNRRLGTNEAKGRARNPVTGAPYAPNKLLRGDYARILAEYWADGPDSETPPGHWNVIFNKVSDHPALTRRYGGVGPELSRLEWDVRGYLALNGAMHDAACAAWTIKHVYDSARPISLIRHMGGLGQSSDPTGPRYHSLGLPLTPGLIEITTAESVAPGGRHASLVEQREGYGDLVGKIVLRTWRGNPADAANQVGGVGWVFADRWVPYQRDTFVTPAFPGYISGHSTFSRTAAEVLTLLTGSPFFPGGLGTQTFPRDQFLAFEKGPSRDVALQWATYYDAADEAGLSRLFGGIHISADDLTGRRLGARIGLEAFRRAHALRWAVDGKADLVNVSTRGVSGSGERVLIAGFVRGAGGSGQVLVRAVGRGLEAFGIPGDLCAPDPDLSVFRSGRDDAPILHNNDWNASPRQAEIGAMSRARGAFPLVSGSGDAAEILDVSEGVFSVHARSGAEGRLPIQLVEVYGDQLLNISTRGYVGSGSSVLIAGFSFTGREPTALLVRGIGPALRSFGIDAPLADPVLHLYRQVHDGTAQLVASNDDWSDDERASLAEVAAATAGAFPLEPNTHDAALFVQLEPGVYSVVLSGKAGAEGIGLVEVYLVR